MSTDPTRIMITIRTIRTPDWPAIMAIQHECYHQFEPEPLEVMQNKTELAPASCWVAERQGKKKVVLKWLLEQRTSTGS